MFYDQYVKLCEGRGEKPTPVAKKLGCSSSNVALWKKGSTPRPAVLSKIAEYFGVTTQFLLFGETDDPTPSIKKSPVPEGTEVGSAKRELLALVDEMTEEQCKKVLAILLEVKKVL